MVSVPQTIIHEQSTDFCKSNKYCALTVSCAARCIRSAQGEGLRKEE